MTLSRKIAVALDQQGRDPNLPTTVSVVDGPNRLAVDLTALDSVGVAFDALEFSTTARPEWSTDELTAWGDRIAQRVTYLMEPLKVVEIDADEGEVQIRSDNPTPRADRRSYYEVLLNRAGVCRFHRHEFDDATRRRRRASCNLTREVLERLIDDIAATASA